MLNDGMIGGNRDVSTCLTPPDVRTARRRRIFARRWRVSNLPGQKAACNVPGLNDESHRHVGELLHIKVLLICSL